MDLQFNPSDQTPATSTPQGQWDEDARDNWHRYLYLRDRGHLDYMATAAKNEGMYLGGGEQWSAEDKAILLAQRRPFYEFNEVLPSVNTAIGHQIQNRMDISFKPRGGDGDLLKATALSKVVMQICDMNNLHWQETQVYGDGLIEQRGYYDVRMSFERNVKGEVKTDFLDPRDCMPDPDAKSYDPDQWGDVTVTRWLNLDEIFQFYGSKARAAAEQSGDDGPDWGVHDMEAERSKFGTIVQVGIADAFNRDAGMMRYRIVDRQKWVIQPEPCVIFPDGDVVTARYMTPEQIQGALAQGATTATRPRRMVKWIVSTYTSTLFLGISPYEHFTIVPYFAYFRRGKTRGMVDNAIGPQEALNKAVSQFVHIINTSANSGWKVEENSLSNMDVDELEERGATTGLVIEYKAGAKSPEKITPNTIPTGVDRLIDRATQALKDVTVPDAMRGLQGNAVSGRAKEADQFASQQQLAIPLDNLTYTRHLLAARILKLVQRYYDSHRVFRITETDPMTGKPAEKILEINKFQPETGDYLNDITIGTYDVVVTEQPIAATFNDSQFDQAMQMREKGVQIPDATVIRYSNLQDKQDILANMQPNPADAANVDLIKAKAALARSQATAVDVETIYSGVQTAQVITMDPAVSPLADSILGSAGYVDKDQAPIVPAMSGPAPGTLPAPGAPPMLPQTNTDPMTPANPPQPESAAVGAHLGIETPRADGGMPR